MKRPVFRPHRVLIAVAAFAPPVALAVAAAPAAPGTDVLVLENAACRLEVEKAHGRLLRLLDKAGGIDLKSPADLAENFRLIVPLPDDPRNFVHGKDQSLSRTETAENTLVLHWDGPMKDAHGNAHTLAATMRIEFDGPAVVFRFSVVNGTGHTVREVWYPAIGGLLGFGPSDSGAGATLNPPPHNARRFARPFGEYLVGYPTQNMAFVEVDHPTLRRGMYLGAHETLARFKAFHFRELTQGDRANVVAGLIHYPYTPAGGTFEGSPLVVQFHDGDWIAGGREIYRPWFIRQFGLMTPENDWIRRHGFYQMIMIMLPEGNVNYTCREIPQIARDGLKYGLTSLQIAGWQFGGHDNGYPYYEPDPRLGTWDDLRDAIRQCHEMGVKIYFFANIHVNNMDTEWYKTELKDYNYESLSGHVCWIGGWGMGTLGSRMGLTTPLMAFADPSFPGMADGHMKYFRKLAEIGADGVHIDKSFPQPINFNPRVVLSPDQAPWEGTVRFVDRMSRECRAIHPDFRLSFETNYDRMLAYGASTWWAGNMSIARKVFPELVETVGLYQPYDYIGVNDAVRNGWAVMVAPFHFNRSMDCEPWRGLAGYIRDVKKVRDALSDYVFTGEMLDADEAAFESRDRPAGVEHAAYRHRRTGRRACILTNRAATPASVTFAGFGQDRNGRVRVFRPAQEPESLDLPAPITVDPERIVFVVEDEPRRNLRLENEYYLVEASPDRGLLTRIRDKRGGLELIREPRLADNFRFTLPLRGQAAWQATEGNYILGREQRLTSHALANAALRLAWDGPLVSSTGRQHDVSAAMTIELAGEDIRFSLTIRNGTDLEIGELYYPILGGTLGLGDTPDARRNTELVVPGSLDVRRAGIYRTFANQSWLGVHGPEQFYSYPDTLSMPWMELNHAALNRSVYFGAHDPVARYKVIHLEMAPGIAGARPDGNWPRPDELQGRAAGVKMSFVHFAYQPPGQAFEAAPVVLRFHDGDWHGGAKIYGDWLRSQGDMDKPRADWLHRTPVFQQCGAVPFKDLPAWARAGADAGARCLLLTDWKAGGHGNGIPRFEPEGRFGTREELAEAIRRCHDAGVKVMLVVNLQTATQLDDRYRTELHRYACVDRWGLVYSTPGPHVGSPLTGGFGSGEQRVWLNPGHPGMRKVLAASLRELAALGVDGVHLQEFFARPLDFNPTVGTTPDRASWAGGIECIREIVRACREVRPEFAVSTDAVWDRVLAVTQVGSAEAGDSCPLRTAADRWQPAFTVSDEESIGPVTSALRYRGRIRIAPANGKPMGGPAMAPLAGYIKATTAVRDALARTLIDGESAPAADVRVDDPIAASVYRDPASGLRTAVLVNPRAEAVEATIAGFDRPSDRPVTLWLAADGAKRVAFPVRVKIPARQAAVMTEEDALAALSAIPRWQAPVRDETVVFDLASADNLQGWTLGGAAFGVSACPPLFARPTLNSLARAGETATGSALSPAFTVEPRFERMEILYHGGNSRRLGGKETLAIRLLDARSGAVLEEVLPPGTHELTTRRIGLDKLRGRAVRVEIVDDNTDAGYAWIGLRRLSLVGALRPANE